MLVFMILWKQVVRLHWRNHRGWRRRKSRLAYMDGKAKHWTMLYDTRTTVVVTGVTANGQIAKMARTCNTGREAIE